MPAANSDISVDLDTLDRFTSRVEDDVTRTLRPGAHRCLPPIASAAGAIGTDGRFDEAVAVRRRGAVTTDSAREFLDLLCEHVASMAVDVRRCARHYEHMDLSAAERTNVERERVWETRHAAPGTPCHIFVLDDPRRDGPGPAGERRLR
ncbi:MAG: hypothetical protein ACFCVF_16720 [Kineosporiaceae bacterium]